MPKDKSLKYLRKIMVRQVRSYDCAPTAVMNACIWSQKKRTFLIRELRPIIEQNMKITKSGVTLENFDKELRALGQKYEYSVTKEDNSKIDNILSLLRKKDHAICLAHLDESGEPHLSFWFIDSDGEIYGANVYTGIGLESEQALKEIHERAEKKNMPQTVWCIRRNRDKDS